MFRTVAGVGLCLLAAALAVGQDTAFVPAQYRAGTLPVLPTTAVGGGEVLLDAAVDVRGNVTGVTPQRATPPFRAGRSARRESREPIRPLMCS